MRLERRTKALQCGRVLRGRMRTTHPSCAPSALRHAQLSMVAARRPAHSEVGLQTRKSRRALLGVHREGRRLLDLEGSSRPRRLRPVACWCAYSPRSPLGLRALRRPSSTREGVGSFRVRSSRVCQPRACETCDPTGKRPAGRHHYCAEPRQDALPTRASLRRRQHEVRRSRGALVPCLRTGASARISESAKGVAPFD